MRGTLGVYVYASFECVGALEGRLGYVRIRSVCLSQQMLVRYEVHEVCRGAIFVSFDNPLANGVCLMYKL